MYLYHSPQRVCSALPCLSSLFVISSLLVISSLFYQPVHDIPG